jgi:hypothetical protein
MMKKDLLLSYAFLLLLTVLSALISNSFIVSVMTVSLLMFFAAFKFVLVAFQFMELKKAHSFWKISLIMTLGLLVILIVGVK